MTNGHQRPFQERTPDCPGPDTQASLPVAFSARYGCPGQTVSLRSGEGCEGKAPLCRSIWATAE